MSRINAIHHKYLLGQSKLEEVANFQLPYNYGNYVCLLQGWDFDIYHIFGITFSVTFSILGAKNESNFDFVWLCDTSIRRIECSYSCSFSIFTPSYLQFANEKQTNNMPTS